MALDVSDERQWSLLLQLHTGGSSGGKLGKFLKDNGFPHDTTIKPMGKYYTHIRNKNVRVMALPSETRLDFIREQMGLLVKPAPSDSRIQLIDIMVGLCQDGKRKLISVLADMPREDRSEFIRLMCSI
jgi:hypothetical protein